MMPQRSWRLWGSSPVVGSSRKRIGRIGDERRREVEATAHAARVGLGDAVGGVAQAEVLEELARRRHDVGLVEVVEQADHAQVLETR